MATRNSRALDVAVTFRTRLGSIGTAFFVDAALFALAAQKVRNASISITLLSDREMHALNREWLQHDYPTDIITFPLESDPLEAEIVISLDTARRQSREYRVALRSELARLVLHGILHLTGFDDDTEEHRAVMKRREDLLLKQCPGVPGYSPDAELT
ncbi:MAG: rRNA maturation RNase YbeY [Bacteroidia bacterium]|nr:rRNA maturation RNase YbeY [Bacteroidia bacterium]